MSDPSPNGRRRLRLRYRATCSVCGIALSPGTEAFWDRDEKEATCLACDSIGPSALVNGAAGASAGAKAHELVEHAKRRAQREWGDHAAAVAAQIAPETRSVQSWKKGEAGESRLAAFVERELGDRVVALHDRIIPGAGKRNIDHLVVAPTGVWVVDAKAYKGKLEKRDAGPFWRADFRVYVGGRDRTKLVDGMALQIKAVTAALEPDPAFEGVALHAALCFVESDWGLLQRPFTVRGVSVLYPGALRARLKRDGNLSREAMERIATRLALSLPPATER